VHRQSNKRRSRPINPFESEIRTLRHKGRRMPRISSIYDADIYEISPTVSFRVQKRNTDFNLAACDRRLARRHRKESQDGRDNYRRVKERSSMSAFIDTARKYGDTCIISVHIYMCTRYPRTRPGLPFDVTNTGAALCRETHFLKPVLGCPRTVGRRADYIFPFGNRLASSPCLAPRAAWRTYVAYFIPVSKNESQTRGGLLSAAN